MRAAALARAAEDRADANRLVAHRYRRPLEVGAHPLLFRQRIAVDELEGVAALLKLLKQRDDALAIEVVLPVVFPDVRRDFTGAPLPHRLLEQAVIGDIAADVG